MLGWVFTFFVLAAVAAYLGFFSLLGPAAMVAKIFLAIFLILLAISAAMTAFRGRPPA